MRVSLIECKTCRFWIQYTKEDLERKPELADIGLCHQFRSAKWLFRMHRDKFCGHGELKNE